MHRLQRRPDRRNCGVDLNRRNVLPRQRATKDQAELSAGPGPDTDIGTGNRAKALRHRGLHLLLARVQRDRFGAVADPRMHQAEREAQLAGSRVDRDPLLFTGGGASVAHPVWGDLGQLEIAKVRADVGHVGVGQRALEGNLEGALRAPGVGGVVTDADVARTNIVHRLQRALDVGSHGGGVGAVVDITRHPAIEFNAELPAGDDRIHVDPSKLHVDYVLAQQAAAKAHQIGALVVERHADTGTAERAERAVEHALHCVGRGAEVDPCRGVGLPGVPELQRECAGGVAFVHQYPLNFGNRRRAILHQLVVERCAAVAEGLVTDVGVVERAHKADGVALAPAVAGVIGHADVGRGRAQHGGKGSLQVELVLRRVAHHEVASAGHACARGLDAGLDRHQRDILARKAAAKAQVVLARSDPMGDLHLRAADLAKAGRDSSLHLGLRGVGGNAGTGIDLARVLQAQGIADRLWVAADDQVLLFGNGRHTVGDVMQTCLDAVECAAVDPQGGKIGASQIAFEADLEAGGLAQRMVGIDLDRHIARADARQRRHGALDAGGHHRIVGTVVNGTGAERAQRDLEAAPRHAWRRVQIGAQIGQILAHQAAAEADQVVAPIQADADARAQRRERRVERALHLVGRGTKSDAGGAVAAPVVVQRQNEVARAAGVQVDALGLAARTAALLDVPGNDLARDALDYGDVGDVGVGQRASEVDVVGVPDAPSAGEVLVEVDADVRLVGGQQAGEGLADTALVVLQLVADVTHVHRLGAKGDGVVANGWLEPGGRNREVDRFDFAAAARARCRLLRYQHAGLSRRATDHVQAQTLHFIRSGACLGVGADRAIGAQKHAVAARQRGLGEDHAVELGLAGHALVDLGDVDRDRNRVACQRFDDQLLDFADPALGLAHRAHTGADRGRRRHHTDAGDVNPGQCADELDAVALKAVAADVHVCGTHTIERLDRRGQRCDDLGVALFAGDAYLGRVRTCTLALAQSQGAYQIRRQIKLELSVDLGHHLGLGRQGDALVDTELQVARRHRQAVDTDKLCQTGIGLQTGEFEAGILLVGNQR